MARGRAHGELESILLHAGMNGMWTAAMMAWRRKPALQPSLLTLGWVALEFGLVAMPFAVRTLSREQSPARAPARESSRSGAWRLAGADTVAAPLAVVFLLAEWPQQESTASAPAPSESRVPTLAELEECVAATTGSSNNSPRATRRCCASSFPKAPLQSSRALRSETTPPDTRLAHALDAGLAVRGRK